MFQVICADTFWMVQPGASYAESANRLRTLNIKLDIDLAYVRCIVCVDQSRGVYYAEKPCKVFTLAFGCDTCRKACCCLQSPTDSAHNVNTGTVNEALPQLRCCGHSFEVTFLIYFYLANVCSRSCNLVHKTKSHHAGGRIV